MSWGARASPAGWPGRSAPQLKFVTLDQFDPPPPLDRRQIESDAEADAFQA